ncbi:MAG: pyroglutamyl-peptidase I [Deltaproteobacteria bacterium]|nr:pyroglutamyl-peptidase I [Deltaproteobacteria bacterium]
MRVLLTGFGPFGDVASNPSERLARHFAPRVVTLALPTSFARAARGMREALGADEFDVVLMLGVAESAQAVHVETQGRNRDEARIADVDGAQRRGPIVDGGPEVLPVTIDVARVQGALASAGLAARLSGSAGAYVCNHLLYATLFHLRETSTRAGFLHLPADRHTHAPPRCERAFDEHVAAVEAALSAL